MTAKLAFYKDKGTWVDKAIRWWTKSEYSHVELVINNVWYSTSPRTQKVEARLIAPKKNHWDFIKVDVDFEAIKKLYNRTQNAKYDWTGIFLSQFLPLNIHDRKRWFCSEWCAEALKLEDSNKYSPEDLYKEMR